MTPRRPEPSVDAPREALLSFALAFVESASQITGVRRISLLGSLATSRPVPKDVDLLVEIDDSVDRRRLAASGRRLAGHAQSCNLGGEVFLVDPEGSYLGRTCRFVRCHLRASCPGRACREGSHIQDDRHAFTLDPDARDAGTRHLGWHATVRGAS